MRLFYLIEDGWASSRYYFHGTDKGVIDIIKNGLNSAAYSKLDFYHRPDGRPLLTKPRDGHSYLTRDPRVAFAYGQWIFVFDGDDIKSEEAEADEDLVYMVYKYGGRSPSNPNIDLGEIASLKTQYPKVFDQLAQEIYTIKTKMGEKDPGKGDLLANSVVGINRVDLYDMISQPLKAQLTKISMNISIPHVIYPKFLFYMPFRFKYDGEPLLSMSKSLDDIATPIPLFPLSKAISAINKIKPRAPDQKVDPEAEAARAAEIQKYKRYGIALATWREDMQKIFKNELANVEPEKEWLKHWERYAKAHVKLKDPHVWMAALSLYKKYPQDIMAASERSVIQAEIAAMDLKYPPPKL